MDIKTTGPTLTQETNAAVDPKGGVSSGPGMQSFMSQFVIRTMAGDLKNHPKKELSSSQLAPKLIQGFSVTPAQSAQKETKSITDAPVKQTDKTKNLKEQKIAQEAANRQAREKDLAEKQKIIDARNAAKKELTRLFEQANLKIAAKEFNAAISDAQKIADDPNAGWLKKWRASRLMNKAQKGLLQQNLTDKPEKGAALSAQQAIKTTMAAPGASKPMVPPITKPTVMTPDFQISAAGQTPVPAVKIARTDSAQPTPMPVGAPPDLPIMEEAPAKPMKEIKEPELFIETNPEPLKIPVPLRGEQIENLIAPAPQKPAVLTPRPPSAQIPIGLTPQTFEEKTIDIKKILIVGLPSLAVLALVVGGIWFLLNGPAEQPNEIEISQTPVPSQITLSPSPNTAPKAIFETDAQKIFILKDDQEKADLQEALLQMTETEEPVGNFIQILFKNSMGEFLSLDKIASSTGIDFFNLPTQTSAGNLENQLDMSKASFFAYSQNSNQNENSPFNATLANTGRIGLAVIINSTSTDMLAKSLKDLEQLMLKGLDILLPGAKNNLPPNAVFADATHSGATIRYVNLPNFNLSLDYAILNNKLIFATSKESMFAIIDRILSPGSQLNQP